MLFFSKIDNSININKSLLARITAIEPRSDLEWSRFLNC
jgi:hypothetical protein